MVGKVTVEGIVASLPLLQGADRRKIQMALEYLERGSEVEQSASPAELLWDQIVSVGADRGFMLPPSSRVSKMSGWKQFRTDAATALEHMQELCPPRDETERLHLARLCARALLHRIQKLKQEIGLQATPMVVMRQAVNIPAAVASQWPGGSSELKFVLRRQR